MQASKICMIGDFAVGKTSLVERYVNHHFSDSYMTTVGVSIKTKELSLDSGNTIKLVLWDFAGTEKVSAVEETYLKGAAGYLLVADGTRGSTLDSAVNLQHQTEQLIGVKPFALMLNKLDMTNEWELNQDQVNRLIGSGWPIINSSAKFDTGVNKAFQMLGEKLVGK